MDAPQNFRSAFHGFNREDVVHYLEYINARHLSEVNQLKAENEELRASLSEPAEVSGPDARTEALQAQCAALSAQLEALMAENEALRSQPPVEAPVVVASPASSELDFYRRAEQAERDAREKSELMYFQANGVLNQATSKVENIAAEITVMADEVMGQLTQLQVAVSSSKHALQDAAAIMKTIRPNK